MRRQIWQNWMPAYQTFTMTVVSGNVSVSGVTVRTRDYAKVPGSISASDYEGVKAKTY